MDVNQYLDLFLEESMENVQNINQNLLNLENNQDRFDLLDEVFRSAHTLKGMAATMGIDAITHLTHKMENILDKLKQRKLTLNDKMFTCLFKSVDALENMLEEIRAGNKPCASGEIMATLEAFEKGEIPPDEENKDFGSGAMVPEEGLFNEYEKKLLQVAQERNLTAWKIKIHVDQGCLMKGVRAFMVFRNLETLGEIIKAFPSVSDIEDEKFDDSFMVVLITSQPEEKIQDQIRIISEVIMEQCEEIKLDDGETGNADADGTIQDFEDSKHDVVVSDKKQTVHQTVRVDITRLDKLMNLVGELVINKTRLEQISSTNTMIGLNETIEQINRITTDLQSVVQNVRMVSIEQVFNRFPRMVRDLARDLGKEVNLILEGKETELDRTVIDEIADPLVHLIRNAVDHGLESPRERIALKKNAEGMVRLSAKQEGNHVIIAVEEDGRGLDLASIKDRAIKSGLMTSAQLADMDEPSILNLIFEPGFSTAKAVTDVSGRGVGLDVVRSKIQALSGQVSLETKPGQGTKFTVKLPLTVAIIQALMVGVQDETFAIPLGNINETTGLETGDIKNIQGQQVMVLRGQVLPLVFIKNVMAVPGERVAEELYAVVVRKGEHQVGLVVDGLIGQQEIVISSLGKHLSGLPGIAGASILGDGRVSLILDIATLI